MADTLFNVLDHHTIRKTAKNVLRHPLMSNENLGKTVSKGRLNGPIKPLEPSKKGLKPGEVKKSFLSNAGQALQSTPVRQVFSPKITINSPIIYTEETDSGIYMEDVEFTKPPQRFDAVWDEFSSCKRVQRNSPVVTPPPKISSHSMTQFSDDDNFSDFSIGSLSDDDLGLPDPY